MNRLLRLILVWLACAAPLRGAALPSGFIEEPVASGWNEAAGLTFGRNADGLKERIYVWERTGRVWIVENGQKLATPLINISDEVGGYWDYGLLGFALDPNFQQNGCIYLLYVVDRYHLLYAGTPGYNAATDMYFQATIGRVTRYTARASDDFRSVDPASRKVLLGETAATGIPLCSDSHGVGSLVFGTDGSLLVSCGDGASYSGTDTGGGAAGAYGNQALSDGILTPAQNVGAYRCQLLDSQSGKILRLDPATGDGLPDNPFFNAAAPRSARSRVWARGLRNPFRFCLKPGTGDHHPGTANPGTLYIGDVGWSSAEELNVATGPGKNFGWPLYEGNYQQPQYWGAKPASMDGSGVTYPVLAWHDFAQMRAGGTVYNMGTPGCPAAGASFTGSCSTGGTWYAGTDFPAAWQNVYFLADYSGTGKWIRAITMNAADEVSAVREFAIAAGSVIFLTTHPVNGGLYYIPWGGPPMKVSYAPNGNAAPVAVADADRTWGPGPLLVNFFGHLSTDPEAGQLKFAWNFGDGGTSTEMNPAHTYAPVGTQAAKFTATLTVTDGGGRSSQASVVIGVNATPPLASITSPLNGSHYATGQGNRTYPLTATVSGGPGLSYQWTSFLHHNDHIHSDPPDTRFPSSFTITTDAPEAQNFYFYEVKLKVTDALGLTTGDVTQIFPETGTLPVATVADAAACWKSGAQLVPVLSNDRGSVAEAALASLEVVTAPAHGAVTMDPLAGQCLYVHNGDGAAADSFSYRVKSPAGAWSAPAVVTMTIIPPPSANANHLPRALQDRVEVAEGGSVVVPVLANDVDPQGGLNPASVRITSRPLHGYVRLGAGGVVTYFHQAGRGARDQFSYQVADFNGGWTAPTVVQIFVRVPHPLSLWQAATPGAGTNADANTDGDLFPDLLEYALGGEPASGASPGAEAWLELTDTTVAFAYKRAPGRQGINYSLECSSDLATWTDCPLSPVVSAGPGVLETVRISGLQSVPGLSAGLGFVRIKVATTLLDPPAVARTLPLGWYAREFTQGFGSFGCGFRRTPVFSSRVVASAAREVTVQGVPVLPAGEAWFMEVLDGPYAGNRFGVDAAGVAGAKIPLTVGCPCCTMGTLPSLTGSRIALCAHQTVGSLFDKARFKGSTNMAAADRLLFFRNEGDGRESFQTVFLLDGRPASNVLYWRSTASSGDMATRVVEPGEGVFVRRQGAGSSRVLVSGQVRANPFVQPLKQGFNLVADPFPVPLSPVLRGLTPQAGFSASTNQAAADRVQTVLSNSSYTSWFLFDAAAPAADFWRLGSGSSSPQDSAPIFARGQAAFLKRTAPLPAYTISPPWAP